MENIHFAEAQPWTCLCYTFVCCCFISVLLLMIMELSGLHVIRILYFLFCVDFHRFYSFVSNVNLHERDGERHEESSRFNQHTIRKCLSDR